MAADKLVLCNALCFLTHRYGKTAVKVLKSVLLDFYSDKDLSAAKCQLLKDTEGLKSSIKFPHIPERREGENRATRIVDDIISIMTCLDEHIKLNSLPKYVSDSPDSMPSTRLYEGDLVAIMNKLEKLAAQVSDQGSTLSAIVSEVRAAQAQVRPSTYSGQVCGQSGEVNMSRSAGSTYQQDRAAATCTAVSISHQSADGQASWSTQRSGCDWSSAFPPQIALHNRYGVLATTDDELSADDQRYVEYESRSAKRRRRKTSPVNQQNTTSSTQQQQQHLRQSKRVVMGKGSTDVNGLTAAKKIVKKCVFCVDNISPAIDVDKLRRFVSKMDVKVISCFEVKPRRQRHEVGPILDRKAFRLCIDRDDCERLLVDSHWPESVVISEWYFQPPTSERRPVAAATPTTALMSTPTPSTCTTSVPVSTLPVTASPSSAAPASDVGVDHMDHSDDNDNETTITYHNGAASAAIGV